MFFVTPRAECDYFNALSNAALPISVLQEKREENRGSHLHTGDVSAGKSVYRGY